MRVDTQTKRLLQVNADYVAERNDDRDRSALNIAIAATDLMDQPEYEPSVVTPESAIDFLDTHMNQIHAFSKQVLGDIINDHMCARIALHDDQ